MIDRKTKLRMRRKFRDSRSQVEDYGLLAEEQLDKHLIKRLARVFDVRRFVLSWLFLLILLASLVTLQTRNLRSYYEELAPAPGGSYAEGMVGNFTNASPLYATGLVDSSVSKLVFASLLKYNENNQVVGDLAEKWSIDDTGKIYTVTLRPDLSWHDGRALTAEDVVFTFQTIQNPDAGSPLFASWRGITVKAVDPRTITFTLTNSFAPFVYSLTTGIVPKHLLENVQPAQLRSALFNNTKPIGSGPFKWEVIELLGDTPESRQQHIGMRAFEKYHAKTPALSRMLIKTYADEDQLLAGFDNQEVNAVVGLDHTPEKLLLNRDIIEHNVPLTAQNMAFFKTDSELLKDMRVRQALVRSVNVNEIIKGLRYPVKIADEPMLRGQIGYNPTLKQLPTDIEQAKKSLDEAGWKLPTDGLIRSNGKEKLELRFLAQKTTDYIYVTQQLQKAWAAIGVAVKITLVSDSELQAAISGRDYDVLLYGISMGNDPDVFAYWHSTQADPRAQSRLNFSNYKSKQADSALEAGRNRLDSNLRAAKYVPFLQAWRGDAPALALYQPRFLYITRGSLAGFGPKTINSASDRFANVENWMIRQEYTAKKD